MTTTTRFAPSPTGFLHIGGARTALFNWLYARHTGGRFLLRIEDTDRKRSTPDATQAILDGLQWLEIDWDDEPIYQFSRMERHAAVARELLDAGHAYHCYCSPEELAEMRDAARQEGRTALYDGRWRDRDPGEAPEGVSPVVRLKAPRSGETVLDDKVQGSVTVANDQLDDMVLLRADGTPTYMLSVVVDDHDMDITHVIRGDDHLTNAFRQTQIYKALDWAPPEFAHIPLIHGQDGAKMSKRHGALGVDAYRDAGFLPEAMRNYLLRLGWSHGDDEIISTWQATEWFDFGGIGKSPARFDMAKLESVNSHYLKEADDERLYKLIAGDLATHKNAPLNKEDQARVIAGLEGLKPRAKTLLELAAAAAVYVRPRPLNYDPKAEGLLDEDARQRLGEIVERLSTLEDWHEETLETAIKGYAEEAEIKLGKVAQPLRAALTGTTVSPGIFEVMAVFGKEETIARLGDVAA
jgi:glutamyl-tRNA synthetase